MTPDDLARLAIPSDPVIHPHGDRIAYVVTRPDLEEDRYVSQIRVARGGDDRRLTAGPRDVWPRWSPDGSRLAFLRAKGEKGAVAQVAVLPADGGEAEVVTEFELGVEQVEWSPTGQALVVVAVTWAEGWEGLDEEERSRRPRRIRSFPYRFDNKGWIHDRRRHLWLVDPAGEREPRCLTPGDWDEVSPSFSPDGSRVAFLSDRDPRRGLVRGVDVLEVDIESGESRRVADRGTWWAVGYRPDGAIHLLGHESLEWPLAGRMYRLEDDGKPTDLTGHLDRESTSLAAGPPRLRWVGDVAYTGLEDAGSFGVIRVHPDGTVDHVVSGRRVVTGFDVSPDGGTIAFTASEVDRPGELHVATGDEETRLTDLTDDALGRVMAEHFTVVSDGHEIDAWVYVPEGQDPVPLLLNIHGGPASQYGFGFFDEFQVYVSAGYGVVACNPRGSSGRGQRFVESVTGEGWGSVDVADVQAVVAAALERFPRLDPDRMGVMGGSYGGFLTAWLIARDHRWASAVVERALLSFPSFGGTSDIGATFPRAYAGVDYPEGWDVWWEKSPLAYAHQVRTPTLVLHAEQDFRCPIEQAEQYFMALLRSGVETELLRFPGEGHEMSRSGTPRHRRERFEAILDWHGRHLGP